MYSTRDDLGPRSAGALHQHLRRAGNRSCFQRCLRLCNPGPTNGQNMAAAHVTKEETRRMCSVLGGSIVKFAIPRALHRSILIGQNSGCISSLVRLVHTIKFTHSEDITFQLTYVAFWTYVPPLLLLQIHAKAPFQDGRSDQRNRLWLSARLAPPVPSTHAQTQEQSHLDFSPHAPKKLRHLSIVKRFST